MRDLGEAVALRPDMVMLGGGNPSCIPEIQAIWRENAKLLIDDPVSFDKSLVCYDSPQGDYSFLKSFADLFSSRFGLPITYKNIAVVSGVQLGAFCLLNLLAGPMADGQKKKVLIPLSPEYVGYADMGIAPDLFIACPGKITYPDQDDKSFFKYVVDFEQINKIVEREKISVILVSRPTNPSGNVLTREELTKLEELARRIDAWLIIDNAYGVPFPGIIEDKSEIESVFWSEKTILTYSLSKIGLPSLRTGFVIAPEEIIERLSAITAVVGLANNSLGQRLTKSLFDSARILTLARDVIQPYYHHKRTEAIRFLRDSLNHFGVEGRLHKSEGAFFLWLWLPELVMGAKKLYKELKEKGVLVIPGDVFFYGLDSFSKNDIEPDYDKSRTQTLRISFSAPEKDLIKGFRIIAETVKGH